jgi:H+/gluconate symporter-like permease
VAQALLTAIGIGLTGLVATAVLGLLGANLSRHISFGIFSSMLTLLAHSMMMFYLIGKGKAVKEALKEGGHPEDDAQYKRFVARFSAARRPVFSMAPLAMLVMMAAAILGASVDTGSMPPIVHRMLAYGGIALNLLAAKIEIDALSESNRIVDEVNRLLGA